MDPAKPPLPIIMNLPFQFSAGIHSSAPIFESEVGFSSSPPRQWRGSEGVAAAGAAPRPGAAAPRPAAGAAPRPAAPGGPKGPACRNPGDTISACGGESDLRLSQGVVVETAVAASNARLKLPNMVDLL